MSKLAWSVIIIKTILVFFVLACCIFSPTPRGVGTLMAFVAGIAWIEIVRGIKKEEDKRNSALTGKEK